MKELLRLHQESLREIMEANLDLAMRLRTESLAIIHDREEDLFIMTIGGAQEAITESVKNRLFIRIDPDTLKIVGIEVPHVSDRLKDEPKLARFLHMFLPMAVPEEQKENDVAQSLLELMPA